MAISLKPEGADDLMIGEAFVEGHQGEKLFLGLLWQPIEAEAGISTAQVVERARGFSGNYYVIHESRSRLGSFFHPEPFLEDAYCGILLLSKLLGSEWLAIFKVNPELYWVAGSRDNLPLSGMDAVFQSFEEAQLCFETFRNLFTWEKLYASSELVKSLDLNRIEPQNFSDLAKQWKLESQALMHPIQKRYWLNKKIKQQKIVVSALVFVFLSFLILGCLTRIALNRKAQTIQASLLRQQREMQKASWRKSCAASNIGETLKMIRSMPLQIGGWRLLQVSWNKQGLQAIYKPVLVYSAEALKAEANALGFAVKIDEKKRSAQLSRALTVLGASEFDALQPMSELHSSIKNLMQGFIKVEGEVKVPTLFVEEVYVFDFKIKSSYCPESLFAKLKLEGITLTELTANLQSNQKITWTVAGKAYGKQ